jgi:hypothetical protein
MGWNGMRCEARGEEKREEERKGKERRGEEKKRKEKRKEWSCPYRAEEMQPPSEMRPSEADKSPSRKA